MGRGGSPQPARWRRSALACVLLVAACGGDDWSVGTMEHALTAYCSVSVSGKGSKKMETDYLPHVVTCENGAADFEALKAQAVAARTFAYYKKASVRDGQSDQVYSCSAQPQQKHIDAVKATSGQVLVYKSAVICSFYVAGAKPSAASCVAKSGDSDPTSTERYVTYNEGKTGSNVKQSSLGWVDPANTVNRGCKSQNGANCLSKHGKKYDEILRFYYGADIKLVTAEGACVTPPEPEPKPDAAAPKPEPDAGVLEPDAGEEPPSGECDPQECATLGRTCCDQLCVDLTSDPLHCGACDNTCGPDERCRDDGYGNAACVKSADLDADGKLTGGCALSRGAALDGAATPLLLLLVAGALSARRRGTRRGSSR